MFCEDVKGMLERGGFQIDEVDYKDDFLAAYVCTKKPEAMRAKSLTVASQQLR